MKSTEPLEDWMPRRGVSTRFAVPGVPSPSTRPDPAPLSRGAYALLALFFGGLGLHHFIAGPREWPWGVAKLLLPLLAALLFALGAPAFALGLILAGGLWCAADAIRGPMT